VVRTIAGRGAWAAEVPEKSTPPPPPGPAAFARESPPVPRSGGGRIRSPGAGPKKGSGSPNWGNYGGQTARISPAGVCGGAWRGAEWIRFRGGEGLWGW